MNKLTAAASCLTLLAGTVAITQPVTRTATPPAHGGTYVLDCAGVLHLLQEGTRQGSSIDLHARSPLVPRGNSTGGTADGCAANGAVYLPASGSLYTLAPTTASVDGTDRQAYRLLRFQMPGASFAGAVPVPGSYETAPRLESTAAGQVEVIADDHAWVWDGKAMQPAPVPDLLGAPVRDGYARLDLRSYQAGAGVPQEVAVSPVQHSGAAVLVRYVQPGKGFAYAVVVPSQHRFTALDLPFSTTSEHLQLAPGGGAVLAQEAARRGTSPAAQSTGRLALVAIPGGRVQRVWVEPVLAGRAPVGITPAGSLVLFAKGQFRAESLRQTFATDPVWTVDHPSGTALFVIP